MSRAVVAGFVVITLALAACSGGGSATSLLGEAPACPLLTQLAQIGENVARANVSDPAAFDAALRHAVASYVHTAKGLRTVVPSSLRGDVDQMIAAAQRHRFADADAARTRIDEYTQSACKTT